MVTTYEKATQRDVLEARYGSQLVNLVDMAQTLIDGYRSKAEAGELTVEEAQQRALTAVAALRYGEANEAGQRDGYLWINDMGEPFPRMVLHPIKPQLQGQVLDNPVFNCAEGRDENLFVAMVDVCRAHGEGYVMYDWSKPGFEDNQPKLSFVRLIDDWNWVVGTGIYVDSAEAEALAKMREIVSQMRFDGGITFGLTISPRPKGPVLRVW